MRHSRSIASAFFFKDGRRRRPMLSHKGRGEVPLRASTDANSLALFTQTTPHSRGVFRPGFALKCRLLRDQRAWGMPGAQCTRSRACSVESTRVSHREVTGKSPGIPARDGFNGFLRALPGDRALLPPSPRRIFPRNLTPASGRQDHTTSPSASSAVRQERIRVHRIPPRVDDVAQRPSFGTGRAKQCS